MGAMRGWAGQCQVWGADACGHRETVAGWKFSGARRVGQMRLTGPCEEPVGERVRDMT
jgi:hypothetical protein